MFSYLGRDLFSSKKYYSESRVFLSNVISLIDTDVNKWFSKSCNAFFYSYHFSPVRIYNRKNQNFDCQFYPLRSFRTDTNNNGSSTDIVKVDTSVVSSYDNKCTDKSFLGRDSQKITKKEVDKNDKINLNDNLRPVEILKELNKHIIGQHDAKRAVAIAMRNRWRRRHLPDDLMKEVTPRNVLMIGPTGCGKTEVARRMASLNDAPFIKVEATKFTEVGYHGRDVDQIIRDLMDISINLTKKRKTEEFHKAAMLLTTERILDILIGSKSKESQRESYRGMLEEGLLDEQQIEVEVPISLPEKTGTFILGGTGDSNNPNLTAMTDFLSRMTGGQLGKGSTPTERKVLSISDAKTVILDREIDIMLDSVDIKKESVTAVEETGIVFIDEIDKICSSRDVGSRSTDASAEGVQRDLLPLVEGTTVSTKYGNIRTDYILFIASGAFHSIKPSDMLPELQGRLPIRVELNALTENDLYQILTEPVSNLLRQQIELIATEHVTLRFDDDAVKEISRIAALLNKTLENIGARRLHTVIERIMDNISFDASELDTGMAVTVTKNLVKEKLSNFISSNDFSQYIL